MGTVFKPFVTRPLPDGAQLVTRAGKRVAVWADASGKKRQAPATDGDTPRIRVRGGTYTAQFKDGSGVVRRVPTGCKSLDAARAVLADLESRADKVRAGIVTQAEANVAEHADTPAVEHAEAYVAALARKRGKGAKRTVSSQHVANVDYTLRLAFDECGFRWLRDLNRDAVERWVHRLLDLPDDEVLDDNGNVVTPRRPAARTINAKLATLTAWGNWLVESGRLTANPFARLRKLDEADDVRRQRRALTADELRRLLTVARLRPVAEYGRATVRIVDDTRPAKSRATWTKAELTFDTLVATAERGRGRLRPDVLTRLEQAGRERALLYAVLVTTGLRKGELAALTVGDVLLDEPHPVIVLPGADAKNGQRATLPLRADVVAELRAWIDEKAEAVCRERVGVAGVVMPPADVPLFDVPTGLIRILNRDLDAAGIPKCDDRGRTVDVHAMRGTFGSMLAAAGVPPVVLKELMRHKRIETTLKHYVDPRLLDVAGAVAALPALTAGPTPEAARSTGTDDASAVALTVALTSSRSRPNSTVRDQLDESSDDDDTTNKSQKRRVSCVLPAKTEKRAKGLEPSTSSLGSSVPTVVSAGNTALMASPAGRCTVRCTENAERRDELARVVALVAQLPGTDDERAGLLARAVELLGLIGK
jgi:integrase